MSALRVRLGFLIGVAALLLASPTPLSMGIGLGICLAGEGVRVWASGHIEKMRALATGGPYAHTQNPLYFGSALIALGVVVATASVRAGLAVVTYVLIFYPPVIRQEAAYLATAFAGEHAQWVSAVPRFLPRLTPGGPAASHFQWGRVNANREWRTVVALPLLLGLLYLRGLWR